MPSGFISVNEDCVHAAEKSSKLSFTRKERNTAFYYHVTIRTEYLENTRKGFFCWMCALEGQKNLFNTWWLFRWIYSRRFYYKYEFCLEIIDAIDATTFHITYDF